MSDTASKKQFVFDYLDSNKDAVALLSDNLFYFGELGMQEFESAGLMADLLETSGFSVQRGVAGFPTGFIAKFGSGKPVIAIHTEYDANPDNSQQSGVTEKSAIVEGAPGHCEGHNCNSAVMVAAGIAVSKAMTEFGIEGQIVIVGAPAEEQLISRPFFVREGVFDDVDLAFHTHVADNFTTEYGEMRTSVVSATFTFHGESAHAAMAPWKARNALDAVILMDTGLAHYREHIDPGMSCHRVITHGGDQPNVIPAKASIWWYFRDPTAEGARKLFDHACDVAKGAALMTKTTYDIDVMSAVWPVRGNEVAANIVQKNIELVGLPDWTEEEQALAREIQTKAKVEAVGLKTAIPPLDGPSPRKAAANDAGDVSWVVPMGHVRFPSNLPNIGYHHWSAGVVLATSIAHKGAMVGAKALAVSALEFMLDADLLAHARETFKEEISGTEYKSLLPPDQTAPTDLNRKTMEAFRPLMKEHYLSEKPVFS